MSKVEIRQARAEDCEQILGLIKELAAFEQMPDKVEITAEVLRQDGFGEDKVFRCLVAELTDEDGRSLLVGMALYYYVYSTWQGCSMYLEDLYVKPNHRGKGIGTSLWQSVAKVAIRRKCKRMDWVCLAWNEKSVCLYKRNGAIDLTSDEQWHLFRFRQQQLEDFASKENNVVSNIVVNI